MAELTRQAGLGPWSQLGDTGRRLQILAATGDAAQVLPEVERLRERMRALPAEGGANENVDPWNVREGIFGTGREAALALGRWQDALDLNAEVLASKRRRGAGPHEIARTAFNDYSPLLSLRRLDQADRLLRHCSRNPVAAGRPVLAGPAGVSAGPAQHESIVGALLINSTGRSGPPNGRGQAAASTIRTAAHNDADAARGGAGCCGRRFAHAVGSCSWSGLPGEGAQDLGEAFRFLDEGRVAAALEDHDL